jgi:hypothetical protein
VSKGANKDFQSDPGKFLRDNVIITKEGKMPPKEGIYLINLKESDMDTAIDGNDNKLGAFVAFDAAKDIWTGSAHSHRFRAFWLPWQPNQTKLLDLSNEADYLFMPAFTGCTFAAKGQPNPRVGHFNYLDSEGMIDPEAILDFVYHVFFPPLDAYWDKAMSASGQENVQRYVFIVGWRTGGRWKFVAQKLDLIKMEFKRQFRRTDPPEEIRDGEDIE